MNTSIDPLRLEAYTLQHTWMCGQKQKVYVSHTKVRTLMRPTDQTWMNKEKKQNTQNIACNLGIRHVLTPNIYWSSLPNLCSECLHFESGSVLAGWEQFEHHWMFSGQRAQKGPSYSANNQRLESDLFLPAPSLNFNPCTIFQWWHALMSSYCLATVYLELAVICRNQIQKDIKVVLLWLQTKENQLHPTLKCSLWGMCLRIDVTCSHRRC